MKADLRKAPVALEGDILTKKRIARVSQNILSQDAWFHTANELIEAMKFLEPHIESYWKAFNAQFPGQDCEPEPEHSLTKVHMMLAGFAIENLYKGYLVGRLSTEDQNAVGAGRLPKSLRTHDTLELIEMTGMTLSGTEKFLVQLSEPSSEVAIACASWSMVGAN